MTATSVIDALVPPNYKSPAKTPDDKFVASRAKTNPGEWADEVAPSFHGTKADLAAMLILAMSVDPKSLAHKPKLLEVVRERLRTEEAYLGWIRGYVVFYGRRHPRTMGAPEVTTFLSHLATQEKERRRRNWEGDARCSRAPLFVKTLPGELAGRT